MKIFLRTILLAVLLTSWGCQKSNKTEHDHEHDHEASDAIEVSGNQALYNEVMKIHDEVMPKIEDIHKKKEELRKKLVSNPDMTAEEKEKLQASIANLDSAGESMMVWMREFNPLPDSTGEEKAREYLENEMERIRKVRENILRALENAEQK